MKYSSMFGHSIEAAIIHRYHPSTLLPASPARQATATKWPLPSILPFITDERAHLLPLAAHPGGLAISMSGTSASLSSLARYTASLWKAGSASVLSLPALCWQKKRGLVP